MRKILLSETLDQIRVAVVDNQRLTNFYIDNVNEQASIRGNIYKALKNPKAKGIEASFVKISHDRSAFLSSFHPMKADVDKGESTTNQIKDKNFIMVQGVSDYDPRKAPKVSDFIALPSKYCVIVSKPGFFGISRKINNEEKRSSLKSLKKYVTKNIGIILRTSAENQRKKDIIDDIKETKIKWRAIRNSFKLNKESGIIHQEDNLIDNTLREFLNQETNEIIVDSRKTFNYFKKNLLHSDKNIKLSISSTKKNLFETNGVDKEISKIFHKKVNLKNGSFLLIEEKEGLTVVDINSGRSLNNKKESNMTVNMFAAREVAQQIILRNLSGIVLIDFIDLNSANDKRKVFKTFKDSMRKDKAKHSILTMSKFGIIEMTRQKKGSRTTSLVSESCSYCHGSGLVTKKDIICYDIVREIILHKKETKKKVIKIKINSDLLDTFSEIIQNNKNNSSIKGIDLQIVKNNSNELYKII
ncbi:hypothetical protein HN450_00655 [bacterium]|nr:hypothetical protein [bacterium]MBT3850689.1 hypothetical protein [bacterium]MBT4633855.1 hypothetical protein [bacterium]MDG2446204.1 ribonuclease E/G [Thermodesulfobacteriota bacterium]